MSNNENRKSRNKLRLSFLAEAAVVFVIGAANHFLFDAIGRWAPLGWAAPVNESLWEHLKMAFWPAMIVGGVLNARLPTIEHRLVCTTAAAWIATLLVVPLFYAYTHILGHHHLAADVAIFAVAVAAGHWVAYRVAIGPRPSRLSTATAVGLASALAAAMIVFTYAPPRMEVFRDSSTDRYGLERGETSDPATR